MTTADPPLPFTNQADSYRLVRAQIEFEANLISQRLNWFLASQSFLFSAYAITLNAPREAAAPDYPIQQRLIYHLIPVVAIASCVLIYLAVLAGVYAEIHLRRFLQSRLSNEQLNEFPPIQGAHTTHLLGLAAPLGLPIVFVAVWIFLWARGLA